MKKLIVALLLCTGCPNSASNSEPVNVQWEIIEPFPYGYGNLRRTKTPEGWLLWLGAGLTYVPDPEHKWCAPEVESND